MLEHKHNPNLKNAVTFVALFFGLAVGIPLTIAEIMVAYHWIFPYALIMGLIGLALTNIMFTATFPSHPIIDYIDSYLPLSKFQSFVLPLLICLLGFRLKGTGILVGYLWNVFSPEAPSPDPGAHLFLAILSILLTGVLPGYIIFPMNAQDAADHATMKEQAHIRRLRVRLNLVYAEYHIQRITSTKWVTRRLSVKAVRGEITGPQAELLRGLLALPAPQQQLTASSDPELRSLEDEERRSTRGLLGN